jgi:hypothetical protein
MGAERVDETDFMLRVWPRASVMAENSWTGNATFDIAVGFLFDLNPLPVCEHLKYIYMLLPRIFRYRTLLAQVIVVHRPILPDAPNTTIGVVFGFVEVVGGPSKRSCPEVGPLLIENVTAGRWMNFGSVGVLKG